MCRACDVSIERSWRCFQHAGALPEWPRPQIDRQKHCFEQAEAGRPRNKPCPTDFTGDWANDCPPITWGRSWIGKSLLAPRHLPSSSSWPPPERPQRRIWAAMSTAIRVTPTRLGRFTATTARMIRYLGIIGEVRILASGLTAPGLLVMTNALLAI